MLDRLRSLAVFARVVDLGSFRAAARDLSLSPSVVSHHVRALEQALAVPLLYRSTRRLALTPDGEQVLAAAREMVDAATRGLDAASGRSPSGVLRLTAPAFLADTRLTHHLAAFAAEYPRVKLTVSFTDQPRDLLRDGLDLALRVGTLDDSTHKTRKLADLHRVLAGSPRYLERQKRPLTPEDLTTWDYVQLSTRPPEVALSAKGHKPVAFTFTPRIAVDSAAAMRALVLEGVGIATLPEVTVRADLARGRLVEPLPGWKPRTLGVHAVWPKNAPRAGLTARFVAFMADRVAELFARP
ncbi:MAG: LysR family transcriptional regulator [Myxococcales bacterium]|nr:LysR family transcriptional regulator [Myxococcales bacterium]